MLANFIARFKEPSSWAGVSAILLTLGLSLPAEVNVAITYVGAGAAGLLAFFLREKGAEKK